MLTHTAAVQGASGAAAAQALVEQMKTKGVEAPDLIALYATEALADADLIHTVRAAFPQASLFGGTSCRGVITETGVYRGEPGAAGLLAISDRQGGYGVGAAPLGADPAAAAKAAAHAALENAGRPFEMPALLWICQPPGVEEAVLEGLAASFGAQCPIMGGSSADDAIAGRWSQFSHDGVVQGHVVVAALFPSGEFGVAFQSGYEPTAIRGRVTGGEGRRVNALDSRPAAQVYAEWAAQPIDPSEPGAILAESTHTPLGRRLGRCDGVEEYLLAHPASVEADGAITLFADVKEGEEVIAMTGDMDSLVARAGRVARDAAALAQTRPEAIRGGLVIYPGGCMMAVDDRLEDVAAGIRHAVGAAPFLSAFTFGEQGATLTAGNRHGNLMVAASVFGDGR